MKKIIAFILAVMFLFSFAIGEENQTETVLKMKHVVKTSNRVFSGEYTGETLNGLPHGYGVFNFFDTKKAYPAHYLGEWNNGEMCGQGGLYCDDGESQVGTFEHNSMVRGEIRSTHSEWRYIDYTPNEHGCYDIIDTLGNGKSFHGCMNPKTGLYHQGTLFTPSGNVEIDTDTGKLYPSAADSAEGAENATYVLNIKSNKFHIPSCDSLERTKEENKRNFHGEREELIAQKYEPCGSCNP